MKTTNIIKTAVWMTLLAGMSVAQVKNVAVVETEIDAQSDMSAKMNRAEIREITEELRREAVKNLPRDRYNIMTTETVMAQMGAKIEECAEENCVVALGGRIGADYIVRGTVRKTQTRFTLSVNVYETDDGYLVATSEAVRSESIEGLIEKTASVCAEMYKTFVNAQRAKQKQPTMMYTITATVNPPNGGTVSRNPNQTYYAQGTVVSVTAIPADGYEFTGWSGAATSTKTTLTAPIDRDLILTANFKYVQKTYMLTTKVSPLGGGFITRDPDKETYAAGEVVTVTATPASGYTFIEWTGSAMRRTSYVTIRMDCDKWIAASFYKNLEFQSKNETTVLSKAVARKPNLGTIKSRKFEYYIAPKYQQELGHGFLPSVNLEGGLVWRYGNFLGIDFVGMDFSFGDYRRIDSIFVGGVGVSLGNVYDFGNQWQFVYGGSMGLWFGAYGYDELREADNLYLDLLAAFVKLRWKFVELTYRGLFGGDHKGPCYNQQLMVGLYFATNKRER